MNFEFQMPLDDPRREKFCQEIAYGMPLRQAYEAAGFRPNAGNCLRMCKRPQVSERIQQIKQERVALYHKAFEKVVDKIALDKADIVRMLLEDRQKAQKANQFGTSVKCLELIGKMIGAFEQENAEKTAPLDGLSGDRLKQILDAIDGQREAGSQEADQREALNGVSSESVSGDGGISSGIIPPAHEIH